MSVKYNFNNDYIAEKYVNFRPTYPLKLYDTILSYLKEGLGGYDKKYSLAIDVGCGSGQTTFDLCQYFDNVKGVDVSEAQIKQGEISRDKLKKDNKLNGQVDFHLGSASDLSFLEDNSVDLITVGTALHWFDVETFCQECHRVLKSGGTLAAFTYSYGCSRLTNGQDFNTYNTIFEKLTTEYGDANVGHVFRKYVEFDPIFSKTFRHFQRDDTIKLEKDFSLDGAIGFIQSTSAYRKLMQLDEAKCLKLIKDIKTSFHEIYGNQAPENAIHYSCDLCLLMGRK